MSLSASDEQLHSVRETLMEIKMDLQRAARPGLKAAFREVLADRMTLFRCLVPAILNFLQQWTGVNGVVS